MQRMNNCFEYFSNIQIGLQRDAIIKIAYHWKKWAKRRKQERLREEELAKKNRTSIKKKKTTNASNLPQTSQKRGSISKGSVSRPAADSKRSQVSNPSSKGTSKNAQKTETVFMTGLKKENSQDKHNKSNASLNQKSQESLHDKTGESPTQRSIKNEDPIMQVEKLNLLNTDIVQS